ncbi:MAG TPA: hypothetical protein VN419_01100 [Humidesulfovibrio sp.]|uniref:hypothetical protein n=1 Tax=Humidesulfovibrio sp. TaxID=2910988 RepID=UPI002BAE3A62|nr:hypothetical protein [Humidesulfovibrio sp.]HWR02586.1 hypothetical protein [Humidesulfovibrio sp.]
MDQKLDIAVAEGEGYFRITLNGPYFSAEVAERHRRLDRIAEASGHTRFLIDVRGVAPRASIPDVFEYVVHNYPPRPDKKRTAALDLAENMVSARFFEHLMQNKGRCYRLFLDEAEAIAWLLSDEP